MKPKTTKKLKIKKEPKNNIEELGDELGNAIATKTLHDSEGGQLLIEGLVSDVLGAMDSLCINVSNYTHIELVALICKMKERLDLLTVMTGAKARKELYEDLLAEAIKEEKKNPPADPHPVQG